MAASELFNLVQNRAKGWLWNGSKVVSGTQRAASGVPQAASDLRLGRDDSCGVGKLQRRNEDGLHLKDAFQAVEALQQQGIPVSTNILYSLLQGCIEKKDLDVGRRVHSVIIRSGCQSNSFLGNHLIRMYAACGSLVEAKQVFSRLHAPNVFVWASMISAHVQHGRADEALQLYQSMKESGLHPDNVLFVAVLKACASSVALGVGRMVHAHVIEQGCGSNIFVGNTLVNMYAKCGRLDHARQVFDSLSTKDLISWTSMIAGYSDHGDGQEALQLFWKMLEEGTQPDKVTLSNILKACSSVAALDEGRVIHAGIVEIGYDSDLYIGSAVIDMYVKCGSLSDARRVFDRMPRRDRVVWTAMLAGYAHHGDGSEAFRLFQQMQSEGMQPDKVTMLSILKACSTIAALKQGQQLHAHIVESGLDTDVSVGNTLIDMYGKCGSLEDARTVFKELPEKDLVSWNAMMGGYAQHGDGEMALQLFYQMRREGVHPNKVTFVCLLSACSHSGLLEEGTRLFQAMYEQFGVAADMDHYLCMIDMLGRSGRLLEAHEFITSLPVQADSSLWMSLLGASRIHRNVDIGQLSFEAILSLDPTIAAAYVIMGDIYGAAGRLEDKASIRKMMQKAGARKEPGRTWMELDSRVHTFLVEDKDHPERKEIYTNLERISRDIASASLL